MLVGGIVGSAALIAVITVAARVMGFGRWLAFAPTVGQSCVGEAYATANQLPNVLFEVVAGGALAGAVVPLLAGPLGRGIAGRGDVDRIASALLTWALFVLVPLSVLLALVAHPVVSLMLDDDGRCDGRLRLAASLLQVFAPQVAMYGVGVVLVGILQAQRRFVWPALAPLLSSLVVIASYLAFKALADGAQSSIPDLSASARGWLGWGTTAGVALMTLPLLLPVMRSGVRLRPTLRFPPGVARRALALSGAGILVLLAQQASVVVIFRLAVNAGQTGAINVYQYTQAVYLLPYAVLAVPLATTVFPRLAAAVATGDREGFARTAAGSTRVLVAVAVVGAVVLVAIAPAVASFFASIDVGGVAPGMSAALTAMAPGLVGFALIAHVGRALYALDRAAVGATAQIVGWLTVVVAAVVGVETASLLSDVVVGLSIAGSLGMTLAGVLLLQGLRESAGPEAVRGVARTFAAAALGGVPALIAGRVVSDALLSAWGVGMWAAVASAVPAAVVAAALSLGVVALVERRDLAALRGRRHAGAETSSDRGGE